MTDHNQPLNFLGQDMAVEIAQLEQEDYTQRILRQLKPRFSPRPIILAITTLVGALWTASQMIDVLTVFSKSTPTATASQLSFSGMTLTLPVSLTVAAFVAITTVCLMITARD